MIEINSGTSEVQSHDSFNVSLSPIIERQKTQDICSIPF